MGHGHQSMRVLSIIFISRILKYVPTVGISYFPCMLKYAVCRTQQGLTQNLIYPGLVTRQNSRCYTETKTSVFQPGTYGLSTLGQCLPCNCDPQNSLSLQCDLESGQCPCRSNVIFTDSRTCSGCQMGWYSDIPGTCTRESLNNKITYNTGFRRLLWYKMPIYMWIPIFWGPHPISF